jgi:hypothetical protein
MVTDEETFRRALDARGILIPGALAAPARTRAYTVFAQRTDAALDLDALRNQATRFFGAKIGLTFDKRYDGFAPDEDAARIVLATSDAVTSGTRLVYGRRAHSGDLAAAEQAERAQGTTGMALLAQRCGVVWLVALEGHDDKASLTLAAIFASVLLGPILDPNGKELFGVRTARMKLEGRPAPYR